MKIVLRHKITGLYYQAPGKWVRRADNALAFDEADLARKFCRENHLIEIQAVHRLAPYLMPLLHEPNHFIWEDWLGGRFRQWCSASADVFGRN